MVQTATPAPSRHEQRLPMRYEDFLALSEEGGHAEWVDGEGSSSYRRHSAISD